MSPLALRGAPTGLAAPGLVTTSERAGRAEGLGSSAVWKNHQPSARTPSASKLNRNGRRKGEFITARGPAYSNVTGAAGAGAAGAAAGAGPLASRTTPGPVIVTVG